MSVEGTRGPWGREQACVGAYVEIFFVGRDDDAADDGAAVHGGFTARYRHGALCLLCVCGRRHVVNKSKKATTRVVCIVTITMAVSDLCVSE